MTVSQRWRLHTIRLARVSRSFASYNNRIENKSYTVTSYASPKNENKKQISQDPAKVV